MQKLKKERDLLKGALKDLDAELESLRESKVQLEKKLRSLDSQLDTIEGQKIRLRDLITLSMKTEAILLKKKTGARDRLAELDKRIQKVRTIERELAEEV